MAIYLASIVLAVLAGFSSAVDPTFSDSVLNVHLVPHTHDDPGWLKTVDQCYYGANNTIQYCGVQYILDTVLSELVQNKDRTFIYAEQSFFMRWWNEQPFEKRQAVKAVVENGQLEFVNGGWVMHDEAASHFVSMIDQTTYGHRFLKEIFGVTPKVGWQIDPFGHSATQAAFMSAEVGFDALYFGRIDYQDHNKRMREKNLEMIWRASASLGEKAEVFTGAFQSGNYGPPSGFCFDQLCKDTPIMDDPLLEDNNVKQMVDDFVAAANEMKKHARGNHIVMNMGSDFHYQNAHAWYTNLDKLIEHVNEDGRLNVFYSTMSIYTQAKHSENLDWSVKTDDFFPYADCDHCYWTGYFTSRPTLKRFERMSSGYLQTLKQLAVLSGKPWVAEPQISALTAGVGLLNHHDAITGTSKQHVAYDYMKILDKALTGAEQTVAQQLASVAFQTQDTEVAKQIGDTQILQQCRLMNESVCDATTQVGSGAIAVVVYNQLPRTRSLQVTVLLSTADASVLIEGKDPINSQIFATAKSPVTDTSGTYTLVFTAENVAPLSAARYVVLLNAAGAARKAQLSDMQRLAVRGGENIVVSNDIYTLEFSSIDGSLAKVSRLDKEVSTTFTDTFSYYKGFPASSNLEVSETAQKQEEMLKAMKPEEIKHSHYSFGMVQSTTQPSGAYVFRPSRADEVPTDVTTAPVTIEVVSGPEVTEVRRYTDSWVSSIVRLRRGSDLIEYEWNVGPVPINDRKGKEVIVRFQTGLSNDETFYTDSNGREFLKRINNYRPTWDLQVTEPVAGNYYPITAASYIVDEDQDLQFSVLTDRSQSMASIVDGSIEVMVHRRLLVDDWRGVGEPLDETDGGMSGYPTWIRYGDGIKVTGTLYLHLDSKSTAMSAVRSHMDDIFLQPVVAYGDSNTASLVKMTIAAPSGLGYDLPTNIHLLSLQPWGPNTLLVRLAHQFSVGEDADLSTTTEVDLAQLLEPLGSISSLTEMSLSANQERSTMEANRLKWSALAKKVVRPAVSGFVVSLDPMEIKTFVVELQ